MSPYPIYERTAGDHGFAPIHRALGAVRVLRHEWALQRCPDSGVATMLCTRCADQAQANGQTPERAVQPSDYIRHDVAELGRDSAHPQQSAEPAAFVEPRCLAPV